MKHFTSILNNWLNSGLSGHVTGKLILSVSFLFVLSSIFAQTNDDCMGCHEDKTLSKVRKGEKVLLFVNLKTFNASVHRIVKCAACHKDANKEFTGYLTHATHNSNHILNRTC